MSAGKKIYLNRKGQLMEGGLCSNDAFTFICVQKYDTTLRTHVVMTSECVSSPR